jgi:ribosomal protein S15P/S13E
LLRDQAIFGKITVDMTSHILKTRMGFVSELIVKFEIPSYLQKGLESGALERIGGVVRERTNGQVVAWLRDSVAYEQQTAKAAPNPSSPIYGVIQASQVRQLSTGASLTTSQLMKLSVAGQMVNLAVSVLSFGVLLQRLDDLEKQIQGLGEAILQEFKRDRDNDFQVALEAARDVYEHADKNQKDLAARSAIDRLKSARNNFLRDFENAVIDRSNREKIKLAQALLERAIYAQIAVARCYWVTGNADTAAKQLGEELPKFKKHVKSLIEALLSPDPALYFEASIPPERLAQFFNVQHWLHDGSDAITAESMFEILQELRKDFFRPDLSEKITQSTQAQPPTPLPVVGVVLSKFSQSSKRSESDWRTPLLKNLERSLVLIENYQRLEGYELEIRTARLSLEEWEKLVDAKRLAEHGGALIIDEEALEASTKRLQ